MTIRCRVLRDNIDLSNGKKVSNMNYEIVDLKEKQVVGLIARTNNNAPDIGAVIGGLWNRFYQEGIYASIEKKANEKALGIYTDYANDEKEDYSVLVACEVEQVETLPEGTLSRTIPAGKYAKFVVTGHMQKAVADFWQELWTMDLPRLFSCDFEEYQNEDMENAQVHIYISLKE